MKRYWKYKYVLLLPLFLILAFSRRIFLTLHIPVSFHDTLTIIFVLITGILVFIILEEVTRTLFTTDEKKPENPNVPEPSENKISGKD